MVLEEGKEYKVLNIYIGKENVPENVFLVYDVDAYFEIAPSINKTELVERVLREVEKAEYVNETTFKDRASRYLDVTKMSTGTKALVLCEKFSQYAINFSEVGSNVWQLLAYVDDCKVYLNDASVFRLYCDLQEIKLNGELVKNSSELNRRLEMLW